MCIVRATAVLLVLAAATPSTTQGQTTTGWPIDPMDVEHPLGNTLGEFWIVDADDGPYQHTGVDILATPNPDPSAPSVRVTVDGTVKFFNPTSPTVEVLVNGTDGKVYVYRYQHLEDYAAAFVPIGNNKGIAPANTAIAKVAPRGCGYDHLHYDIFTGGNYVNPLRQISPNPDPNAPEIAVHFMSHGSDPWSEMASTTANCTIVRGQVDIVVHAKDQDSPDLTDPGAANVGLANLRWRPCPSGTPNCSDWKETHLFDGMPRAWEDPGNDFSRAQFSLTSPWISSVSECTSSGNNTYMVPTSFAPTGSWDTTTGYPDGLYTLTVEAFDQVNTATEEIHVCVQNGPGCATDLAVRDAPDDTGAVPYLGSPMHVSPDITVNPGSTDENKNVRQGALNQIDVQVWNRGSCPLPAGSNYNVCLGWNPPSGSVPFPLAASQEIDCKTETVPPGGWAPAQSRTSTFNWSPVSGSVPSGHACVVAWIDAPGDAPKTSSSVIVDNNRAQRNVSFVPLPPDNGASSSAHFWVYPLPDVTERSLEITFTSSGDVPPARAYLVIPPSVYVRNLINARVIASFRGSQLPQRCLAGEEEMCSQCPSEESSPRQTCTKVLGGFDRGGRIRLEGITVDKPTRLLLGLISEGAEPSRGAFEAMVIERGGRNPHQPIGGVTLRFEAPR